MKTAIIYCLLIFLPFVGKSQQDTIFVNEWKMADSLYGELGALVPTGYLMNRTLMDSTVSFAFNAHKTDQYTPNADYFYRLMYEMKLMALDSSTVPGLLNLYYSSSKYIGDKMFEEDRYVYPVGIADYNYNWLDEEYGEQQGLLTKNGLSYNDADTSNASAYSQHRVQLTAPLFDNYSSPSMGLVFKSEHFFSNHKDTNDIDFLEVYIDSNWWMVGFNEIIDFVPTYEDIQYFKLRVTYHDGEQFENDILIHTPEQAILDQEIEDRGAGGCDFGANLTNEVDGNLNLLQACYIPSCKNEQNGTKNIGKTYMLITGYRPPIFLQSFNKTWKLYNDYHGHLLSNIKEANYDIYLIRFNLYNLPQTHGMIQSGELLIKFIEEINAMKPDKHEENVIQASSMGTEIANYALLKMEKTHFQDNTYPHHHTRLLIAYDGNYYGANIPLAFQYQIYSGFLQPAINTFPISQNPTVMGTFLRTYLYASMEQKAVKELLMYHADAKDYFLNNNIALKLQPTHAPQRENILNALNLVNNDYGKYFIPMPNSPRHIAISLGKISGPNNWSNTDDIQFKDPGEYWLDFTVSPYISKIRSAIYTNEFTDLFRRKKLGMNILPLSLNVDHKIEVSNMQEIDVAAGSYLTGMGNVIEVTARTYNDLTTPFPFSTRKHHFSHKSVLTALAINKNLWPTDGSMLLNMQSLGLMYNEFNFNINEPSDHYGYPNLGRPNDHFDITPFEAIYVDHNIDPHIDLEDRDQVDLAALNGFILNEVEPWYLGLQNQNLGAQARPNYIYKSRRVARYGIVVGHNVTPTTDLGDYTVKPNGDLILFAGEYIDLFPGSTFEEGSKGTLHLGYLTCAELYGKSYHGGNEDENMSTQAMDNHSLDQTNKNTTIRLFPNPTSGTCTVESITNKTISRIKIYNFSGTLVIDEKSLNTQRHVINGRLDKGTYIVVVDMNGEIIREKLVVL